MAREWRAHLDASRARRARMTPDPSVPGLWTAHLTGPLPSRRAQKPRRQP